MSGPGHRAAHDGLCTKCQSVFMLPMAKAIIVGRRFIWVCPTCDHRNRVRLTRHNALKLRLMFHTAYGTRISPDEVKAFAANLDGLDKAVVSEIGP